ncbi:glycosyltransferase family 2 protein [Kitasatospora herbaricolor]|uniref:Glycosyltransferase n=1 Tax=Kitasatospora herbaricolor TaxID=68217 RepID=A0ABZ1WE70_9ACTN|nr:glycosyltransferase family 2 protein [Kitasatospora herbaricolor]
MTDGKYALIDLAMALSLLFSLMFVCYVVFLVVPFVRHKPRPSGDAGDFQWHFFIPCRDEEAVIGDTLAYLRGHFPSTHLWVVDDDSDDATGAITAARQAADPYVHLVQRRRPEARTGKSEALNAAYRALVGWLPADAVLEQIVVGVFDADGHPEPGGLDVMAAGHLFGDPVVGAVQCEVRMRNRDERRPVPDGGRLRNLAARTLVRLQDLEFRTTTAAVQMARRHTRTVGMGGNGQFTRLSAMRAITEGGTGPWRGALLEDFELGLDLMLDGWRTAYTTDTSVDQEGLWSLRRLITQRTRWGQGNMQCTRYLARVWRSPKLSHSGVMEISYYLLLPWFQVFASLVFPVLLFWFARGMVRGDGGFLADGGWGLCIGAALGITQFAMWGPIYRWRCEREAGFWSSLGWGLAYAFYIYIFYVTAWRALARIVTGRGQWAKTRRNAELRVEGPTAIEF